MQQTTISMPEGNAERSGFLFPPPQHVQILPEELRARDRTCLWRSMASPVQLGFQCCQWKSHTVQQEQSRHSAEGSYLFVSSCGCHPFSVSIGSFCTCLPGVLIRKVTGEKQNVSVWQNKASVSPPSGLATLFRTCPRIWCRHLLPGDKSRTGEFIYSAILSQKYVFCLHFILLCLCFAVGLQFQSGSKWFRGRGIYSASACGCVSHQPDSASSLLSHQQDRELLQPTRKDLHQHCEVWSCFVTVTRSIRFPLLTLSGDLAFIVSFVPRNVILKMSILGILCFYWLDFVPNKISVGALRVHFIMGY